MTLEFHRSDLLEFYLNRGNSSGYFLDEILFNWTIEDWDHTHDFIQWLFPLKEESAFNADAPILTDHDIRIFKDSIFHRNRLMFMEEYLPLFRNVVTAFIRFTTFLGLNNNNVIGKTIMDNPIIPMAWDGINSKVVRHHWPDDPERLKKYVLRENHNWLRITRCLKSMKLLGLDFMAQALFDWLGVHWNQHQTITLEAFQYWQDAVLEEV